jgi:hypothetical protein
MRTKAYEQQYSEALAELRSRGSKIASPHTAPDGIRRVQIDNLSLCIDRLVFEKAWGQEIAEHIIRKNGLHATPHLVSDR